MKIYTLRQTQFLPISLSDAWAFFSSPANLGKITPSAMNFKIMHVTGGEKTFAGQIIQYKVTVLPLMRLQWITEITHVEEPFHFIDEQRFGPYALWHHEHRFKEVQGGIEMSDELVYALPFGFLGRFAHWLFVGSRVNAIFEFRTQVLDKIFPAK